MVSPAGIWPESTGINISVSCNNEQDPGKKMKTPRKKNSLNHFTFRGIKIDR
jgi:hypothetical protein